jgi:hypothetical protein
MQWRARLFATLLSYLGGLASCSVLAEGPAPTRPRSAAPRCDTSKALVVVDGVATSVLVLGGVAALVRSDDLGGSIAAPIAVGSVIGSFAYAVAAGRGNTRANRCRAAMREPR